MSARSLSFRASDRVTGVGIRILWPGRTDCRVASRREASALGALLAITDFFDTRKSRPPGRLFCCIYPSKGTPNICQNCRFSLSDTMAEFHEPNVKLAQLSVPFSTDTVRPSSNVTVSLAVNQQAAPLP